MRGFETPEQIHTLVIGAGQAGLSAGYHLARRGIPFLIVDANKRIGDAWRNRWDSLRLFTPAGYCGLAGLKFPGNANYFPTKDEMAAYLERYAEHFRLPVRTGTRVSSLVRRGRRYLVSTDQGQFEAEHVIVAMAKYQVPHVPGYAAELDSKVIQIHSAEYRNPGQLLPGEVLIAGAGNSGAEIAMEVTRTHRTWVAGRDTGHVPFRINGLAARLFLRRLIFRVIFHRVLTTKNPVGRKARAKILAQGGPLIRVRPSDLAAAGVERVPRIAGVRNGLPLLADGRVLDVANVIWCTGFGHGFSWIKLPILDQFGEPQQDSGVVSGEPGLYFIGLPFIYAFSSTMIHGVGRDAERVARVIDSRRKGRMDRMDPERAEGAESSQEPGSHEVAVSRP